MTATWTKYVLIETVISAAINGIISVGFVFLMFHGEAHVAATGPGGLLRDAFPQTFLVALMATLVPCSLTGKRHRRGLLPNSVQARSVVPRHLLLRGLIFASISLVVGVSLQAWYLTRIVPLGLDFFVVLPEKAVYGAILGAIVTWIALRWQWKNEA